MTIDRGPFYDQPTVYDDVPHWGPIDSIVARSCECNSPPGALLTPRYTPDAGCDVVASRLAETA